MKMKKKASILAASLAVMMLGVQSVYAAPAKPDVKILATGGTIAGSAASDTQTTGYKAGALGIDVLTVRNIKAAVIVFGIIHAILAGPSIVPC